MRFIRLRNAKNQSYIDMKLKDLPSGKYLMDDGSYWIVRNGISDLFKKQTIAIEVTNGEHPPRSRSEFSYPEEITVGKWVDKFNPYYGDLSVPLKKVSGLPYEEKPSAKPKSKTALRNTMMRNLETGMYLMDDGTYWYIEFCQKISPYDLVPPGQVGFREDVAKKAEMFGARPQALIWDGRWANIGALQCTQYDQNGRRLNGSGDLLYWDLETFEHFCKRRTFSSDRVLPVGKVPDDEAKRIRRH